MESIEMERVTVCECAVHIKRTALMVLRSGNGLFPGLALIVIPAISIVSAEGFLSGIATILRHPYESTLDSKSIKSLCTTRIYDVH